MKFILISIFLVFSTTHAQDIVEAINSLTDVIVPCALESGTSSDSLIAIEKGDLSGVQELYGCFTDCISRKIGIITDDDAFHVNVVQDHLRKIVKEEIVMLITEKCGDKIGTENCTYSGTLYHCVIDTMWGVYFS